MDSLCYNTIIREGIIMKITEDNIMEGLLVADALLNLKPIHLKDLREICEQCVYFIYGDKL